MDDERTLPWNDRAISIGRLGTKPDPSERLPSALSAVLALAERSFYLPEDLELVCPDDVARELADRLSSRADMLARTRGIPRLGDTSPHDIARTIAFVVAEGMTYDAPSLPPESWFGRIATTARRLASGVGALFEDSPKLASSVLEGRVQRGTCRHYATIVRTLFYAVKRATGRSGAFVVGVAGEAGPRSDGTGHAWNLFGDDESGALAAFDVTWGDALAEGGQVASLENAMLDAPMHLHASAFLATLLHGHLLEGSALYQREEVGEALRAIIAPATDRGRDLLFQVADNPITATAARSRIARYLARTDLDCLVPDWRDRLARRTAMAGEVTWGKDDAELIGSLLDAM